MAATAPPTDQEKSGFYDGPAAGFENDVPPAFEGAQVQEDGDGEVINYKTLEWWQGSIVLIAETVSLGILSLPSAMAALGLVPGIIMIIVLAIMSTYSGLVLGEFRKAYPFVRNFGDAVQIIGESVGMGPLFQEIFGWGQVIFQIFVMGSHIQTWTICLNNLTDSSVCTVAWAFVGLAVFWACNIPRTLKYTSYMSMTSCISITTAVIITIVDVAIERPIGDGSISVVKSTGFTTAFLPILNMSIAFSSHSCFFSVIAEFKKPEDWPKSLALLQVFNLVLYLLTAIIIYVFVGDSVPSPALSAAGSPIVRKVIWGIAIPTIVIAGVIYAHVACSYVFTRVFNNTKHMVRRTKLSTLAWFVITFVCWALALVIAQSIPIFNNLLGLFGALFVSWFSYGLPGIFWLWMQSGKWFAGGKRSAAFVANVLLVVAGVMLFALGLWSSIEAIAEGGTTKPWTCATNVDPPSDELLN